MSERLAITTLLPDLELPSAGGGTLFPLRSSMGRTTILVGVHSAACEACRRYVDELASTSAEFNAWDARLVVVVPGPRAAAKQLQPPFGTVLSDEAGEVSSPDDAAAIVADRYGQIFEACHAGEGHRLPSPRQLEEWLRFLGTLCPE